MRCIYPPPTYISGVALVGLLGIQMKMHSLRQSDSGFATRLNIQWISLPPGGYKSNRNNLLGGNILTCKRNHIICLINATQGTRLEFCGIFCTG